MSKKLITITVLLLCIVHLASAETELMPPGECYQEILDVIDYMQEATTYQLHPVQQARLEKVSNECKHTRFSNQADLIQATYLLYEQEYSRAAQYATRIDDNPYSKELALEATQILLRSAYDAGDCEAYTHYHDEYQTAFPQDRARNTYEEFRNDCDELLEQQEAISDQQETSDTLIVGEGARSIAQTLTEQLPGNFHSYEQADPCSESCECEAPIGRRLGYQHTIQLTKQTCDSVATRHADARIQSTADQETYRVAYAWGVLRGLVPVIEVNNPLTSLQGSNCIHPAANPSPDAKICLSGQITNEEEGLMHYYISYTQPSNHQLVSNQQERDLLRT